jgi:hypothetical protein
MYHPISARGNSKQLNLGAIPEALAATVADHIHSTFFLDGIRFRDEPVMTDSEKKEFNEAMVATQEEVELMHSSLNHHPANREPVTPSTAGHLSDESTSPAGGGEESEGSTP